MTLKCLKDVIHIDMLDSAQIKNITYLYNTFLENELLGWSGVDDVLELLEWLDSDQLCRECDVLYSHHKYKNMGCEYDHKPGVTCLVKNILEAVDAILELYKETGNLHVRNRYILVHYLALSQIGKIIELPDPTAY